jgi:hypothetical protein
MTCAGAIAIPPNLVPFVWTLFLLAVSAGRCKLNRVFKAPVFTFQLYVINSCQVLPSISTCASSSWCLLCSAPRYTRPGRL